MSFSKSSVRRESVRSETSSMTKRVRTTRRLEVWLKDSSVPLFVTNIQRRLVFFNVGCERLTGWKSEDVLGKISDYATQPNAHLPDAVLASLAVPADVWNGRPTTAPVSLARRDRDPLSGVIDFYPLTDAEQTVQAALGIIRESAQPDALAPVAKS